MFSQFPALPRVSCSEVGHKMEVKKSLDREKRIADQVRASQPERVTRVYPRGAMLFRRGEAPKGVFYLQEGAVVLSPRRAADGLARMGEQVIAGSLLGLSELFARKKYETSAVCHSLTRVIYVEKDELFCD
jgi:CRP-like cAMP-binding protein